MTLPFTHEQFLDGFGAYNRSLWPFAAALWLLTLFMLIRWWREGPRASRMVAVVLAIHWAWSAFAYHVAFFRRVNPAATLFAGLFVVQALLFLWRRTSVFAPARSPRGILGSVFLLYALVYPLVGLASGLSFPRWPSFGVPCPTVLLTAGWLLMAPGRDVRLLAIVPLLWTVIGGSAAFLLGMRADLALPVAGAALLYHVARPVTAAA